MKKAKQKTVLNKLLIKKFRALTNVPIEFGSHVTVICGKNGTSKSSILGIAAQIFSFEKDYSTNTDLRYETITGTKFKSLPSEHFRFSQKFDLPGSLAVDVELFDGYSESTATGELALFKRRNSKTARPVVRKNTTAGSANASRNFTHPVIYLSLQRLQPIASREYEIQSFTYLTKHRDLFIALNNEILNKTSSSVTGTGGSIESAVAHDDNYDQDSVSAGEDNAGQIILALMSFRKLKEEYADYRGGLLLIDEADAGLFPAAQIKLLEILERECASLNLQVIMTSHSPVLIEETYELSQKYQRKYKTVYLSDTFGPVRAMPDYSWSQIYADLLTKTIAVSKDISFPKLNVYFEDAEGAELFGKLMLRHPSKRYLNLLPDVSLGCSNYIQLVKRGVPEFSRNSLIVLDADATEGRKFDTVALLPGHLPPDQLIFEFLFNLPDNDPIWDNPIAFTRRLFTNRASQIISTLRITGMVVDIGERIQEFHKRNDDMKPKLRDLFKEVYKNPDFRNFMNLKGASDPWKRWMSENGADVAAFKALFVGKIAKVMQNGYGIDPAKLDVLIVK
jgi:predicted ATPase